MLFTALLVTTGSMVPFQEPLPTRLDTTPILERSVVVGPVGPDGRQLPSYIEGQVLVRFGAGVTEARIARILGAGFAVERELSRGLNLHLVQIVGDATVDQAIAELGAKAGVLYAAPDHVVTNRDTIPNDPRFSQQYGKDNTGQTGGTADADIDAPAAWDTTTGTSEFAVAIVDGGTDHAHEDLIGNRFVNTAEQNGTPGVDDDGNGFVDDIFGWNAFSNSASPGSSSHGTHVAGIAAAQGNNGVGIAGVSWDAEIVSIAGSSGTTSTVILAYSYALSLKDLWLSSGGTSGANVVATNSSFGVDFGDCSSTNFAPWNDMYNLMGQSGILSAAATANQGTNIDNVGDVPTACSSDFVISVTATNDQDRRTFSAFGATTIDLGAPGESVLSTLPGNNYGLNTGTSMATPQVTGAIALLHSAGSPSFAALRAADPAAAALLIKDILIDTVDVVPTLSVETVSGGRMNVEAAVAEIGNFGAAAINYCGPAAANSTGMSGVMALEGSGELAVNDFSLVAANLPVGATVLFVTSRTQDFVMNPGGSAGDLCLGGAIGRFIPQVGSVGADGRYTALIDLAAGLPQPQGFEIPAVGETWNFQAWHRDSVLGLPLTNFTDGLSVIFQ